MLKERSGFQEVGDIKNSCMLTEMTPPRSQRNKKEEWEWLATARRHKGIHLMFSGSLQLWTNQDKALMLNKLCKPLKPKQLKPDIHSSVHLMKD